MTTATSTRPSPRPQWTQHGGRPTQRPSTTPLGLPTRTPGSVGQGGTPHLSTKAKSPVRSNDPRAPSPNYFGLIVEPSNTAADSNNAAHVRGNWSPPSSSIRANAVTSPKALPNESNPEFELFRRQSESGSFTLGHGSMSQYSADSRSERLPTLSNLQRSQSHNLDHPSPKTQPVHNQVQDADSMEVDSRNESQRTADSSSTNSEQSFFDIPRNESPGVASASLETPRLQRNQLSHVDDRHPRLSLPGNRIDPPSPGSRFQHLARAETLPGTFSQETPIMVTPQTLVHLMKTASNDLLLLDLRVFPQYTQSRVQGALNLCIPTTLLKRPSFNVQKLAETFSKDFEKEKFSHWKEVKYIVVYDASSSQMKDATSSVNTLKKFTNEQWRGKPYIIRGGFAEFSNSFPDLVDRQSSNENISVSRSHLSINPQKTGMMPVAGGCPMPVTQSAANPFFGNIRQNMDLIGGVGQMSVKYPAGLTDKGIQELPSWIRMAADENDKGKTVADRFLGIEKAEQKRMQKALTSNVSYGTPTPTSMKAVQIAGIEKGTKNRYKDMLPFDHSRVKLQNVPLGQCDYVNASHVKAEWSNRRYIASQAPVPTTFEDFWRLIWEQDVRVIVMLTAESEGGQRKCHPYWLPSEYGPLKLKSLSEKRVSLVAGSSKLSPNRKMNTAPMKSPPPMRPDIGRRRSTNPYGLSEKTIVKDKMDTDSELPYVIVRKLTLSHNAHPFQPMREITQLQYSNWPDFGAPAHPAHLLGLIEYCGAVIQSSNGRQGTSLGMPAMKGERPIVVHCSAGCGRTGTFCTVDSVVDMLKRQKMVVQKDLQKLHDADDMDVDNDEEEDWLTRDDVDLVAKTVEDLRMQRLSMVQTLRQFVLCYETVLEWLVKEMPDRVRRDGLRRSYQG